MFFLIQIVVVSFLALAAFSLMILVCGVRISRKEGDNYGVVGILLKGLLAMAVYLAISWIYFLYSDNMMTTFILMIMLLILPAIWLIVEIKFKVRTSSQIEKIG
jgi:hypothetical protein